jgi:hypothetical protein
MTSTVIADGFDGACGEGFVAQRTLFLIFGLLEDERVTVIVRARKIVRRSISANITVYTLRVNVVRAEHILFDAIIRVSHKEIVD